MDEIRPLVSKYHLENCIALLSLRPEVRKLFYDFLLRVAMARIYVRITSASRTSQEQDQLFASSRTVPGPVKTWVNDSNSYHTHGLAIDIAPLMLITQSPYPKFATNYSSDVFDQLERLAREIGIEHPYASDKPHFHYSGGIGTFLLKQGIFPPPPDPFETILSSGNRLLLRIHDRTLTRLSAMGYGVSTLHS